MAKRPFKKFNSRESIDAIQFTMVNADKVQKAVGGSRFEEREEGTVLLIPGIPSALVAEYGDYVAIDPETGGYILFLEGDFEANFRVPKTAEEEAESDEDDEDEEETDDVAGDE